MGFYVKMSLTRSMIDLILMYLFKMGAMHGHDTRFVLLK